MVLRQHTQRKIRKHASKLPLCTKYGRYIILKRRNTGGGELDECRTVTYLNDVVSSNLPSVCVCDAESCLVFHERRFIRRKVDACLFFLRQLMICAKDK